MAANADRLRARPEVAIPGWWESENGIIVPSSIAPSVSSSEAADSSGAATVAGYEPPTYWKQVAVYLDEENAGLPRSSLADVRATIEAVPFESAVRGLANVGAKIYAFIGKTDNQLRLARELYGEGPVLAAIRRFLGNRDARPEVFAEQHALVLLRLLIESAGPGRVDEELSSDHTNRLNRALLGVTSVLGEAEATGGKLKRPPRSTAEVLAFFIQNGAYNITANPLGEMARAQELFLRIASDSDHKRRASNYCPIDQWMLDEYGFSVDEQLTVGFGLAAMTHAFDSGWEAGRRAYVLPEHFNDLLVKLDMTERRQGVLDLVSATRETFRSAFRATGETLAHLAWEVRPFMRWPFLRCENGGLILLSPRAMQSWLSNGFHYRLLDAAQAKSERAGDKKRKISQRYTAYAGELLEAYALELVRSVHSGDRPPGGGRVYGEQSYGKKGREKTSDVSVDLGIDLVLFEVSTSRLRADTLILGEEKEVARDLDRMILKKIGQLDHCINQLRNGNATVPDVDIAQVQRIWPVLVTAGAITQSPWLWQYISENGKGWLQQATTQALTILDLEDLEALCGLVESGHALHDLLHGKTQPPYQTLELAMWLAHDPGAPKWVRPRMVEDAWTRSIERANKRFDFGKGLPPAKTAA